MADTTDLLGFAIDKNPIDFASTFDALVRERAVEAVAQAKVEIAQSIYGTSEEGPEVDTGSDDDDIDLEGIDLEDLDFDIDLEDLDDNNE